MHHKVIHNTSKGLLKKLFGKDRISGLAMTDHGYAVLMEKSAAIDIPFDNLQAAKVNFYFDLSPPYRTLTLVTQEGQEYSLDIAPHSGEIEEILKHFAAFQLKGELPGRIEDIRVMLFSGINNYEIRLENGNLAVINNGERTEYPWSQLEYYKIDKPSNNINLKFREKKMFVSLNGIHVTNVWLLLEILKRFAPN